MAKRIGQVLITYETLAQTMGLGSEHKITAVVPQTATDVTNQRFGVIVMGPRLPLTPEGAHPVTTFSFAELAEEND